jgi:NDP-sugar pyrophosphorylase family protein
MTLLSPIQQFRIPYGIVEFGPEGQIRDVLEKPHYTFTINAGVYIVEKRVLKTIPENRPYDMTDLTRSLIDHGENVMMYPLQEENYIDIGQWEEYKKTVNCFQNWGIV